MPAHAAQRLWPGWAAHDAASSRRTLRQSCRRVRHPAAAGRRRPSSGGPQPLRSAAAPAPLTGLLLIDACLLRMNQCMLPGLWGAQNPHQEAYTLVECGHSGIHACGVWPLLHTLRHTRLWSVATPGCTCFYFVSLCWAATAGFACVAGCHS